MCTLFGDNLELVCQQLYERTNDMPWRWLESFTSDLRAREACAYIEYVGSIPCIIASMLLRSVSACYCVSRACERGLPSIFFPTPSDIECGGRSHPVAVTDIYHAIDGASPNVRSPLDIIRETLEILWWLDSNRQGQAFF